MPGTATRKPTLPFDEWIRSLGRARAETAFPAMDVPVPVGAEAGRDTGRPDGVPDRLGPLLLEVSLPQSGRPSAADPIILRFDEPVVAGSGSITLKSPGHRLRIAARDADQVFIEGSLVRLVPDAELRPGASYSLKFSARAFCDLAHNPMRPVTPDKLPSLTIASGESGAAAQAEWTLMVYMAADNDLEPFAVLDLAEMERVRLSDRVNLVVLLDGHPRYGHNTFDFADTLRGPVRFDGDPRRVGSELVSIGERNTGDPETLREFIAWAEESFPAERYGLVIWNHGGGLEGAAWDFSSRGDRLTLDEMRRAIADSGIGRLDFLGFDACLMGMAEVASEFDALARVMVASQDLEPNPGWAYDRWLAALARTPELDAQALSRAAVESYAAEYAKNRGITLSALDLDAMPRLEEALEAFLDTVGQAAEAHELARIARAVRDAQAFPRDASYPYRDLDGFLAAVERRLDDPAIDAAARTARAALDELVLAHAGTVRGANGLSIYLPEPQAAGWSSYVPDRFAFLDAVGWNDFIERLLAVA